MDQEEIPEGVEIEYVPAPIKIDAFADDSAFSNVLHRFTYEDEIEDDDVNEEPMEQSFSEGSDNEDDEEGKLSKKKLKKMTRLTVAQLKQYAAHPEVVEWEDVTAKDPKTLVQLKSVRNSVPVPGHWSRKRKYLAGKRGYVKPPFELPQFIRDTGVTELRQAALDEDATKRQKVKAREKMHPKLGRITVDYEKLHDAFFRYQTKPLLTGHGDLYYEGKEFEGRSRDARPGFLSEELRTALGMGNLYPPPWLHALQKWGAPPAYPHMRIPGFNAPIPEGAQWGFHAGGWGKPPMETFVSPASTGSKDTARVQLMLEPVERNIWGELEPDADAEGESYKLEDQVHVMTLDEEEAEELAYKGGDRAEKAEASALQSLDSLGPETIEPAARPRRR